MALAAFWEIKRPPAPLSKMATDKWVHELSQLPGGAVVAALDVLAKRQGFPPELADVLAEARMQAQTVRAVDEAVRAASKPGPTRDEAEQLWWESCRGPVGPKYTPSFERLTNDSACVISFEPAHHAHGIDWPATHTIIVYAPHASYELRQYGDALATDMRRRWKERGHTSKLRVELEARQAPASRHAA